MQYINATGHQEGAYWSSVWVAYIISKRFSVSKTPFHSVHHALKLIKSQQVNKQQRVTAAERMWGRDEAAHIARLVCGNYTERGTCRIVRNTRNFSSNFRPCR